MRWFLTITDEMTGIGLSGNELIVYAFINGFSQNGNGCYDGSIAYLSEVCGISRRTAITILQRLSDEKHLIDKHTVEMNGLHLVSYRVNKVCAISSHPVQNLHRGSAESAPNIYNDININTLSNKEKASHFEKPSVDEVRAFCESRHNGINPESFVAFYESKGWMVGRNPMRDWRSAIITWENRDNGRRATSASQSKSSSALAENLKVADAMFGTDMYKRTYGKEAGNE